MFFELIWGTKSVLDSVKKITQALQAKFDDKEFGESFFLRTLDADIEKTDSFMNGLMNFLKVSTPVLKANTVHTLVEEVLTKHQAALEGNRGRVITRFEKDLPETTVPDEQLRYILDCLVQHAVDSMGFRGTLGVLTRTFPPRGKTGENPPAEQHRHVEILLLFSGFRTLPQPPWAALGIPGIYNDEPRDLTWLLAKETVLRNRGRIKIETDEKSNRTIITLVIPAERREVVYYLANETPWG